MDRWLSAQEQQAWRALQMMNMQLNAELGRRLTASSDLSLQDYAVLVHLTDDAEGRVRQNELGESLGWEKSRVSHHINRMAKRGLVAKQVCPSDKRGTFVVITQPGRDAIAAAAPDHADSVRSLVIDRLDPDELAAIGTAAEKILAGLQEPEPGSVTRRG